MALNNKFRYIDTGLYDRVSHLLETNEITDKNIQKQLTHVFNLLNIRKDKEKFCEIMKKVELYLLKKSKYNFVMKNIPQYAQNYQTRQDVKVTYLAMRETLDQFGKVHSMYINHGVGFFNMKNNNETNEQLNNMQIGKNIIQTLVV